MKGDSGHRECGLRAAGMKDGQRAPGMRTAGSVTELCETVQEWNGREKEYIEFEEKSGN